MWSRSGSRRLRTYRDPSRSVIAGVFFSPYPALDSALDESCGYRRREQQVIKPHTLISRPPSELVVPECPQRSMGLQLPQGISPALIEELRECFAALRLNQGILIQRPSRIDVLKSRYDIVIPSQHDRDVSSYQLGRVVDQPIKPRQFVRELRPGLRIAIGKINRSKQYPVDGSFDVTGLHVRGITRQAGAGQDRDLASRKDCYPVPRALPAPDGFVADVSQGLGRKISLCGLEFLKANNIGFRRCEPG